MSGAGKERPQTQGDRHWTRRTPERQHRGEARAGHKLTERQVRELRAHRELGATFAALARHYGLCTRTVREIVFRTKWKHVA